MTRPDHPTGALDRGPGDRRAAPAPPPPAEALAVLAADGRIRAVSGALRAILGRDPTGVPLTELVDEADRAELAAALAVVLDRPGTGPATVPVRLGTARGTVPVTVRLANLLDEPGVEAVVATVARAERRGGSDPVPLPTIDLREASVAGPDPPLRDAPVAAAALTGPVVRRANRAAALLAGVGTPEALAGWLLDPVPDTRTPIVHAGLRGTGTAVPVLAVHWGAEDTGDRTVLLLPPSAAPEAPLRTAVTGLTGGARPVMAVWAVSSDGRGVPVTDLPVTDLPVGGVHAGGRPPGLPEAVHPDDRATFEELVRGLGAAPPRRAGGPPAAPPAVTVRIRLGGTWCAMDLRGVRGADRPLIVGVDTDHHHAHRRQLARELRRLGAVVEHMSDAVVLADATGRIRYASPSSAAVLGWPSHLLEGRDLFDLAAAGDTGRLHRIVDRVRRHEGPVGPVRFAARRPDGGTVDIEMSANNRLGDPDVGAIVVTLRDVSAQVAAERRYRTLALHDPLTGLANRRLFQDRLQHALSAGARRGTSTGLLVLDLDRFKDVNDTLGHDAGDELLRQVAARIAPTVRDTDTLARLGGDEFGVVLPEVGGVTEAVTVASRLLAALGPNVEWSGMRLSVAASVGIAVAPEHGADPATLLRRADAAMYRAKAAGGGVAVYETDVDDAAHRRLAAVADVSGAVERGELELHYQPVVDLRAGVVTGAEALLRWRHPDRGLLAPDEFLPAAEQLGVLGAISERVLGDAMAQQAAWAADGLALTVSINLSPVELADPRLADTVERLLRSTGADPARIILEITERATLVSDRPAIENMRRLRARGLRFALDDFGTGFSPLANITRLPVDVIKIDRSFIGAMTGRAADAVVVRSVIELAHRLGLTVVAEGVETEEAFQHLLALSCDAGQGFHLGRPVPPEVFRSAPRRRGLSPPGDGPRSGTAGGA